MTKFVLSAFADEAGDSLAEQLAALKRNGIRRMELRGVDGTSCAELTVARAREIKRTLDGEGVFLSALGSPYGKYPIDAPFAPHLDAFRRGLEVCGALGTDRVRIFSFFVPAGRADEWKDEVLARLERMVSLAEAAGVMPCHENEKGIFGDTAPRCRALLDALGPRLRTVFDPANYVQCGQRIPEALSLMADGTLYAHVKDALFEDGSVVPAGRGDGCAADVLRAFAGRGEPFTLTLEPHLAVFAGLQSLQGERVKHRYAYPTPGAAFDAAADALKELLADMGLRETEIGTWEKP